jgi:tetrahydromethanopterin S-methyltransferase subunit G
MVTIETVYDKLMQLTELCDREFKQIHRRLELIEAKIDTMNDRLLTQEAKLRLHDKRISELEHHPV